MQLHNYETSSGRDVIMEYLNKLDKTERDDGLRVMQDMQRENFDSIYYKQWEKKVFEVYFKKHNRIFYVVVDNKDIYLLHACDKQKNKTEKKNAKIVRQRAKELGHMLNKTFI